MTPRLLGVCGEERAAFEPPVGCGAVFDLAPVNVTVVQSLGAHPALSWATVGRCPVKACEHIVVMERVGHKDAQAWLGEGAALVVVDRPAELDDPKWRDRCPPQSKVRAGQVARCAFSFVCEESLGHEAAELRQEMGL